MDQGKPGGQGAGEGSVEGGGTKERAGTGPGKGEGEGAGEGAGNEGGAEQNPREGAGEEAGAVAGEDMRAGAAAGGEGGPAIPATSCRGHEERRTLEKTMSATRTIKKAKTKLIAVKVPGQNKPVKKSKEELVELFSETKEWKKIRQGETLLIPVFIFLKQAAKSKKKSGSKKLKIVETQERAEEAIIKLKDELVLSGKTLHEAEDELIQSKGVYETFRKVAADKAELDLRDAFARLENGGLFIMSMEMKSVRKICEDLGFQAPKHEGEIDAIYIFAEGDKLRVKLCEVNRPCSFPCTMHADPVNQKSMEESKLL